MVKSYFYDENISDWRELVKGEQGERGERGPIGPQGPAIDIETGLPISVDTTVGERVFVGDTMIYGDTGWRDISELFGDGLDPENTGTITLKRRNDDVIIKLDGTLLLQGEGSLSFGNLPLGFRSMTTREVFWGGTRVNNTAHMQIFVILNNTFQWVSTLSRSIVDSTLLATRPISEMRGTVTFPTDNSWPTSLPGSPA